MTTTSSLPWFVLRVRSRHENIVEGHLLQKDINMFLPRYHQVRFRKDRKVSLNSPLFPGYVFVQPSPRQFEQLRFVPGSCGLVFFGSEPAKMPEEDLEGVKALINSGKELSVNPRLIPGTRVEVLSGPFQGVQGELVRIKNQHRLLINAHVVGKSIDVEISAAEVQAI